VCGHSFGAWVGYRAAVADGSVERALLIAPSTRMFDAMPCAPPSWLRSTVFVGDRDELVSVRDVQALAAELNADFRVFEGFDHHFLKSRRALAQAALPVIAPEVALP
jgi:alpha/beta superfamily hydrolase